MPFILCSFVVEMAASETTWNPSHWTYFLAPAGPYAIGLLNPHHWGGQHELNNETVNEITLEVTRVVIAIGVFAIGVELPKVSAVEPRNWLQIASGLTHEYRRTGLFEETLEIVGHALGTWNGRE